MLLSMLFRRRRRPQFTYPGAGSPRIAVIHDTLRARRPSRSFRPEMPDLDVQLARFSPQVIAAPYEVLLALSAAVQPTHAVVVLSKPSGARLITRERDRLWSLFEVPSFEQVISDGGELLASECDAHDGLHILADPAQLGFPAQDGARCRCGSLVPRVPPDTSVYARQRAAASVA